MSKTPYLYRRDNIFYFRIAVPLDLQPIIGVREITQSLRTENRVRAIPSALELAGKAKTIFIGLRSNMDKKKTGEQILSDLANMHDEQRAALIKAAEESEKEPKHTSLRLLAKERQMKCEISDLKDQIIDQVIEHRKQLELVKIESKAEAYDKITQLPTVATIQKATELQDTDVPFLSEIVKECIDNYPTRSTKSKINNSLHVFLAVVGDMRISKLRQKHINDYFTEICNLPTNWRDRQKKGESIACMVKGATDKAISPNTFKDTYKLGVNALIKYGKRNCADVGFPEGLTTEDCKYSGAREKGENKQRAMSASELKKLFESDLMGGYASDPNTAHYCWLPLIGLFTGARINEICQLNPALDIYKEDKVWVFNFTDDSETDDGVDKRVKNKQSKRKVPIHSKLIELGLLSYVKKLRKLDKKLIFPKWTPRDGRPAKNAEKWFSRFLDEVGVKDNTPFKKVVGMHSFRHTFITKAFMDDCGVGTRVFDLTGHERDYDDKFGTASAIGKGYITKEHLERSSIEYKKYIVELFRFDIDFYKPK